MALEQAGVPSVALHTHVFARLAQSVARANGMPRTRQAYVPQPIVDLSPEQLRGYIEGSGPVSRRPFMQEVIEALTNNRAQRLLDSHLARKLDRRGVNRQPLFRLDERVAAL